MTLLDLTNFWRDVSLSHKDVLSFLVGSWYDAATNSDDKYPLVYWELPYSVNFPDINKSVDEVQISFSVFLSTKPDDVNDDNEAISLAKAIGDAIILKAKMSAPAGTFTIVGVNAVSVREYSNDSVAGMRYDLTLLVAREICDNNINEYFNN